VGLNCCSFQCAASIARLNVGTKTEKRAAPS
jgi:hypothetical protein